MTTRFEEPVNIPTLDTGNLTVSNLVVENYSTVMIGGFTTNGQQLGKLLSILERIVNKDYPEELI